MCVSMSACVCVCASECVSLLLRKSVCAVGPLLLRVKPHRKLDSYLMAPNSFINKRPPAGV